MTSFGLKRFFLTVILLFELQLIINASCPATILSPCICTSTQFEPISIVCNRAGSLSNALSSLNKVDSTVVINSLTISRTPVDRIPAFTFQNLKITRLVMNRNNLSSIDAQAFDGPLLNSLEELDLRDNKLGTVPQTGIPRLFNLRTLILSKNTIATLPGSIFSNFQCKASLRRLDLSSNYLRELQPESFIGLAAIEEIKLDKNFLPAIPTASLRPLRSTLQDLSLGVNKITAISTGSLDFPSLKSLSLEVNRLRSLPPMAFKGVPNLVYLYLSGNNIENFDRRLFQYVSKLKVLSMSNNPIGKLSRNSFQFIPGLVRLELSECQLTQIDPGTFQVIKGVQVLALNRNKLKGIPKYLFTSLKELYSLDLKANQLAYVEDRAFASLRVLRHLDLSNNRLQSLQPSTFDASFVRTNPPTSRVLYLYENPWRCDSRLSWLITWLKANPDLMIDAPGYPPSVCFKPSPLYNLPIRRANEGGLPGPPDPGGPSPLGPRLYGKVKLTGVNLAALILGLIMGILILTVVLLLVMRYFVSQRHRNQKEEDDDLRRFGTNSSASGGSGGYLSTTYRGGHHPSSIPTVSSGVHYEGGMARQRGTYFLNRPWYWWF